MARLIRGYSVTAMENIALWHERDISHSSTERVIMPDACLALDYMLSIFTNIIDGLLVYPDAMEKNLNRTKGLVYSQRVMLALIDKGLSRQEAYKMVQRNAMKSWKKSKDFLKLLKADKEVIEKYLPKNWIPSSIINTCALWMKSSEAGTDRKPV